MNDPSEQPIDIEEQRRWMLEHKESTGFTWKQLSGRVGIPNSTLGLFCGNNYNAPGEWIAEAVFRYRQMLTAQASIKAELPEIPTYFNTPTSLELIRLLTGAQRGRMNAAAMSPGLGKTITAKHYGACNSNVFVVTASPAEARLLPATHAVLRALGIPNAMFRSHEASAQVIKRVRDMGNPLLIVDEAQHLSIEAIEQIRSWHDVAGLGIAFLGNAGLLQKLEGGSRSISHAQLFSRLSLKMLRIKPLSGDIDAMLDAWRITDPKMCAFVHEIAMKPGALRGATFTIELAHMIAVSTGEDFAINHLQDAWAQLSSRPVAA